MAGQAIQEFSSTDEIPTFVGAAGLGLVGQTTWVRLPDGTLVPLAYAGAEYAPSRWLVKVFNWLVYQIVTFTSVPASGSYVLHYGGVATAPIAGTASAATVQAALGTIPALTGLVAVTALADGTGFMCVLSLSEPTVLSVTNNTVLNGASGAVTITTGEMPESLVTLPFLRVTGDFAIIEDLVMERLSLDTGGPGDITLTDAPMTLFDGTWNVQVPPAFSQHEALRLNIQGDVLTHVRNTLSPIGFASARDVATSGATFFEWPVLCQAPPFSFYVAGTFVNGVTGARCRLYAKVAGAVELIEGV